MISYDEFIAYLMDEQFMTRTETALFMWAITEEYGGYLEAMEAHGYEEADRETYREAMDDLYYEFTPEYQYTDVYKCGVGEYAIFDDYDDARDAAIKSCLDTIDGVGVDSVAGFEKYVDKSWFEDALREYNDSYASDIENESSSQYENRLVEECYDNNLIDDGDFETDENGEPDYMECTVESWDLRERLSDYLCDNEDAVSWYRDNFGDDAFREVVTFNNLYDRDKIAEYCVSTDGIAHYLAGYDGYEHEYEFDGITYYIYRV